MTSKQTVLSYLESFSSGEAERVVEHVTEDFINEQVSALGEGCSGKSVYRERLTQFLSDFANLQYEANQLVVNGDDVAVGYTMRFSYEGKPVELEGVMLIALRDGLIARRRDYWDGISFLNQTEGPSAPTRTS